MRARSRVALDFFALNPGWLSWHPRTRVKHPRLGPPGASTFPRIWNRSIDPCGKGVKGKTRHVVIILPRCLFVVVLLQAQLFCFVSPRESSRGKLFVEMSEEKFRSDRTSHACKFKVASRFPEMIFSHSIRTLSKRCARQDIVPRVYVFYDCMSWKPRVAKSIDGCNGFNECRHLDSGVFQRFPAGFARERGLRRAESFLIKYFRTVFYGTTALFPWSFHADSLRD